MLLIMKIKINSEGKHVYIASPILEILDVTRLKSN